MSAQREYLKETWASFTATHRPYLTLGCSLLVLRNHKTYLEWGHKNIQEYLKNELHIPFTNYALYIAAAKILISRLEITPKELHEIEKKYPIKKAITTGKVSRTKDEFFQRLTGDYFQENKQKTERVGPFIFTRREMELLKVAGRVIQHPFDIITKRDVMRFAINATANALLVSDWKKSDWIQRRYKKYGLL